MGKDSLGFIALHREIKNHWIFQNDQYFKAFVTILIDVNYTAKDTLIDGEIVRCERGSAAYSIPTWVHRLGNNWTRQKVRSFFKLLEKDGIITVRGLRKTTMITVCNYDTYNPEKPKQNTENNEQNHEKHENRSLNFGRSKITRANNDISTAYKNVQPTDNPQITHRQPQLNKETKKQTLPPNNPPSEKMTVDETIKCHGGRGELECFELVRAALPMAKECNISDAIEGKKYEYVKRVYDATVKDVNDPQSKIRDIGILLTRLKENYTPPAKILNQVQKIARTAKGNNTHRPKHISEYSEEEMTYFKKTFEISFSN